MEIEKEARDRALLAYGDQQSANVLQQTIESHCDVTRGREPAKNVSALLLLRPQFLNELQITHGHGSITVDAC